MRGTIFFLKRREQHYNVKLVSFIGIRDGEEEEEEEDTIACHHRTAPRRSKGALQVYALVYSELKSSSSYKSSCIITVYKSQRQT